MRNERTLTLNDISLLVSHPRAELFLPLIEAMDTLASQDASYARIVQRFLDGDDEPSIHTGLCRPLADASCLSLMGGPRAYPWGAFIAAIKQARDIAARDKIT